MNNYVYDGTEVSLTGRVAVKQVRTTTKTVEDKLVEIKPTDSEGPTWKRWVRETELYKIVTS
jgi:hypothetical protein